MNAVAKHPTLLVSFTHVHKHSVSRTCIYLARVCFKQCPGRADAKRYHVLILFHGTEHRKEIEPSNQWKCLSSGDKSNRVGSREIFMYSSAGKETL